MTIPLLCVAIVACVGLKPELTINLLDAAEVGNLKVLSDETGASQPKIKRGEEKVRYSMAFNRIYVFRVYGVAIQKAGLFGFGTEAVTGFPINVPLGQQDLETLREIRTVDNAFLLMGLRFGYLGLVDLHCVVCQCRRRMGSNLC